MSILSFKTSPKQFPKGIFLLSLFSLWLMLFCFTSLGIAKMASSCLLLPVHLQHHSEQCQKETHSVPGNQQHPCTAAMDSIHNSFLTGLEPPFASAKGSMVNKKKKFRKCWQ